MDKICTKCSVLQPPAEFSPLQKGSGGMGSWCKCCKREYARNHYENNKAKYKLKSVEWQKANPAKVKDIKKKYRNG